MNFPKFKNVMCKTKKKIKIIQARIILLYNKALFNNKIKKNNNSSNNNNNNSSNNNNLITHNMIYQISDS